MTQIYIKKLHTAKEQKDEDKYVTQHTTGSRKIKFTQE
jgi:hypothetical protein